MAGFDHLRLAQPAVTLRQQTVEILRQAILECHFKPGDRLIERLLCEMTGVSRTSIREALRQLEAEGLVEVVPNRGPMVAVLSLKEVSDIYELRAAMEGLAARLFVERADEQTMASLVDAFGRMKECLHSGTPAELSRAASEFYDVFLDGCLNKLLASVAKSLSARVVYLRASSMQQPGRGEKSIAEIEQMVNAIVRRDPTAAQVFCEEHIRRAHSASVAELRRQAEAKKGSQRRVRAKSSTG